MNLCRVWVLGLGLLVAMAAAADGRDAYRQGVEAFRAGDHAGALEYFQQAEAAGMQTPTLHFNLGATHYRLENYTAAARYFRRLREDPEWAGLAEYNLGRIAERRNAPQRAAEHYRQALRQSDHERVQRLASTRLDALEQEGALAPGGWSGYLSLGLGYDDNPALATGDDLPPVKDSDVFLETIGNVSGYLRGNRYDGIRLDAGLYSRNHDDTSEFDITGVSAGLALDDRSENWRFERGVSVANYWVDGDQYSTEGTLKLRATRFLGATNVDTRNELTYIEGDGAFDFVTGIRNRLEIAAFRTTGVGTWRLAYRNEYNNRDDLEVDDQFFSYSPWRHTVYGQLRRPITDNLSFRTRLEYRHSRYRDDNREEDPDSGEIREQQRKEDRWSASLLLRYTLNETFSTFGEYRYTDNDADIERYAYESNQVMLGIEAVF